MEDAELQVSRPRELCRRRRDEPANDRSPSAIEGKAGGDVEEKLLSLCQRVVSVESETVHDVGFSVVGVEAGHNSVIRSVTRPVENRVPLLRHDRAVGLSSARPSLVDTSLPLP